MALLFGALANRSVGIYFLMITLTYSVIANLFFGQVTDVSGFGGISGIPAPGAIGNVDAHTNRLYYVALVAALARLRAAALPRANAVRPHAPGRPRRPGAHGVARLQRPAPPHDRVRVRRLHRGDRRRALRLVERPHRPGVDRPRRNHRLAGDRRRRRPLPARGRLGRRPVLRHHQQLLAAHRLHRPALSHVDRRDLPRDRAGLARRPRRPLGARRQPFLRASPRPARPQPVELGPAEPSV